MLLDWQHAHQDEAAAGVRVEGEAYVPFRAVSLEPLEETDRWLLAAARWLGAILAFNRHALTAW